MIGAGVYYIGCVSVVCFSYLFTFLYLNHSSALFSWGVRSQMMEEDDAILWIPGITGAA